MRRGLILSIVFLPLFSFGQDEFGFGAKEDREKSEAVPLVSKPFGYGENLPDRVSLKEYVPSIKSQGSHGTCVGWSSSYYLSSVEYAILKNISNKTEINTNVYDPYYTYLTVIGDPNLDSYYPSDIVACKGGIYTYEACQQLVKNGVKRRIMGEVSCGDDVSSLHNKNNSMVSFLNYDRIYDYYGDLDENVTAACQALTNNHPVLFAMDVPPSFRDISDDGHLKTSSGERNNPNGTRIGVHAMCIVGYDDDKFGGSFIVVNSWGEDFGDDGYLYLEYRDYQAFANEAYSFETELKSLEYSKDNCVYGNCIDGYGIKNVKGNGNFEGFFVNGEMSDGIYINHSKKLFKGGKMYMKKKVKNNYGSWLLYDPNDYKEKKPIGFVLK